MTVRLIQKDAEEKKATFNPRPYFRLFINWLLDLGSLEPLTDGANLQVVLVSHFSSSPPSSSSTRSMKFTVSYVHLINNKIPSKSIMAKLYNGCPFRCNFMKKISFLIILIVK